MDEKTKASMVIITTIGSIILVIIGFIITCLSGISFSLLWLTLKVGGWHIKVRPGKVKTRVWGILGLVFKMPYDLFQWLSNLCYRQATRMTKRRK